MQIIKYTCLKNGNYKIYLDNKEEIILNEEIIIENNLLYKKELDSKLYNKLLKDNDFYNIYNTCIKYITVRLRSIYEIKEYLKKKKVDNNIVDKVIDRLIKNKYLDDERFSKAFINDKLKFSTMGNYKIKLELKKCGVEDIIVEKYINEIEENILINKVNSLITKYLNTNKKVKGIELKNKTYKYLLNLGYSNDLILNELNKYDF